MKTFEERLRQESAGWVADGLLSAEQQAVLLARHPEGEGGGRFLAVLTSVGGVLVLAGVCLLISANWQAIGDWTKILGLVALLVGANVAGWRCQVSPGRWPGPGDVCFMVAAGLFLAGIALVSQIFHLNARPATGVFIWWLGIMAVPWLTGSKAAQFMSTAALLTWLGWEMQTPGSWLVLANTHRWWSETCSFFAVLTLLTLAIWFAGLALRGTQHEVFAGLHEKWGAALTCLGLYLLGFVRHDWDWQNRTVPAGATWLPLALAGVLVVLAGCGAWRQSRREVWAIAPWLGLALVAIGSVYLRWDVGDGGWLWSVLAWVSLFGLNLGMIHAGLATGRAGWINLGIGFIALNILTRYFDLFGTMLEGGLFFVLSGALVLSLGIFLERKRRALLRGLRAKPEEIT